MPSLREDKQPDAVIDLRHRSLQRAQTDEVVLVDDGPPELPPEPVFTHEPVLLDVPGATRKKRRVAELEEIAAVNARAALEARAVAVERHRRLEAATTAWRSTAAELADLRRDLKGFAAARADIIAKERSRAEQAARTDVEAELQQIEAARVELQVEIDHLHVMLTEQQTLSADSTQRLRAEQQQRAKAEKEAKRAIAAYETAERRLETMSEALHRHAADEQARIEAAEAARAEAEAELEALGGGGQVAKLTNRVEDLVVQLGELDTELAAMESRAEAAEAAAEVAVANLATTSADAERASAEVARLQAQLDDVCRERDALRVKVASLEEVNEQWAARATEASARADSAESEWNAAAAGRDDLTTQLAERDAELLDAATGFDAAEAWVAEAEAALASTRRVAEEAKARATVARVRLDEIVDERDTLLATVASLEQAAQERERRAASDLTRAEAALDLADTTGLEEALVAARFDAEALRGETTALAAQLEEAWGQVEEARRVAEAATATARAAHAADAAHPTDAAHETGETGEADAAVDVESTDTADSLLDAFAELAATPDASDGAPVDDGDDRPLEREVRRAPPPPDPEDPDARRAALGFLNSLARDVPASRPHGT
ncbi:MAG: hypothetical protein ACXW1M_02140 [Acidimicrobiia bacterium]